MKVPTKTSKKGGGIDRHLKKAMKNSTDRRRPKTLSSTGLQGDFPEMYFFDFNKCTFSQSESSTFLISTNVHLNTVYRGCMQGRPAMMSDLHVAFRRIVRGRIGFPTLFFDHPGAKNRYFVKQYQRHSQTDLTNNIRRCQNCGEDKDAEGKCGGDA